MRSVLSVLAAIACVTSISSPARAYVDARGNFTTAVPIEVPAFYGLTPSVALRYFGGPTGIAGAGWDLDAASVIIRRSATGGTPRILDAGPDADVFWMDGQELVPCAIGSESPSCSSARAVWGSADGFYSTRIDNFERIQRGPLPDLWTAWERDGTTRTYLADPDHVTYRLWSRIDTHGNRVAYEWGTAGQRNELHAIRYGARADRPGVTIRFFYEARDDVRTAATGAPGLPGRMTYDRRLHSVGVWSDQRDREVLRAYELRYDRSPATGASLLASIQEYPLGTQVSEDGEITAAPDAELLPPVTYGYAAHAPGGWGVPVETTGLTADILPTTPLADRYGPGMGLPLPPGGSEYGTEVGDFDGDRRAEVLVWGVSNSCQTITFRVRLAGIDGVSADIVESSITGGAPIPPPARCFAAVRLGDFNGDGRDDLVVGIGSTMQLALGRPDGRFIAGPATDFWVPTNTGCGVGDVDGDERQDLVCEDPIERMIRTYRLWPGQPWVVDDLATWPEGPKLPDHDRLQLAVADIDGDSLSDVVLARSFAGGTSLTYGISDGLGDYAWEKDFVDHTGAFGAGLLSTPDLDGDGAADLALTTTTTVYPGFSRRGAVSKRFVWQGAYTVSLDAPIFADLDGDGRADLLGDKRDEYRDLSYQLALPGGGYGPVVRRRTARCYNGFEEESNDAVVAAGDLDGDGLADALCFANLATVWVDLEITDRRSQPSGTHRHHWMRLDVDGDGTPELVQVSFANPGYVVKVVWPGTHEVRTIPVTPGGALAGLTDSNPGHWFAVDAGSTADPQGVLGPPDGKADLVLVEPAGAGQLRTTTVLLDGSGTAQQELAIPDLPVPPDRVLDGTNVVTWMPADLDGDRLADLVRIRPNVGAAGVIVDSLRAIGGGRFVALPLTVHFDAGPDALHDPTARWFQPTDVDGDGRTDFVYVSGRSPTIRTLRARAGGFEDVVSSPGGYVEIASTWRLVDMDGDGNVDLVHTERASDGACLTVLVFLGDARGGFELASPGADACVDVAANPGYAHLFDDQDNVVAVDLDGDARPELLHLSHQVMPAGPGLVVTRLTADKDNNWAAAPSAWRFAGDRGDAWSWQAFADPRAGVTGLYYVTEQGTIDLPWARARDELSRIANGIGLVTTIDREQLTRRPDLPVGDLPAGVVPRVVRSVLVRDHAHAPAIGTERLYQYATPRWSTRDKALIGFELRAVMDEHVVVAETFQLDEVCGAQVTGLATYATTGGLLGYTDVGYTDAGAVAPYRCLVDKTEAYDCQSPGDTTAADNYPRCPTGKGRKTEQVDTEYTPWGLPKARSSVAYPGPSPETPMIIDYAEPNPNLVSYIVDAPAWGYAITWNGAWYGHPRLYHNYYDHGQGAPVRGDLTRRVEVDISDAGTIGRTTTMDYDSHGTLTDVTSAGGKRMHVDLDPVYQRYPFVTCVGPALDLCTTTMWDYVRGTGDVVIDPNGQHTTTVRDEYGRVEAVVTPTTRTLTAYLGTGVFTGPERDRQRVKTSIVDGSAGDLELWSVTYFDGSGRTYLTRREGEAAVRTDYIDASSRPWRVSETYAYADDAVPSHYTTYTYDRRGRPTSIRHPDGAQILTEYQLDQVIVTDELGKTRRARVDGRGRTIAVDEVEIGVTRTTRYEYDDIDGRMTSIVDPAGNRSRWRYSSYGRLRDSSDPDRGTRTFLYYPDGELYEQRDAIEQTITYEIDALGRLDARTDRDATGAVQRVVDWQYDPPGNPTHGSSVGRLVRVDDTQYLGAGTQGSTEVWYDVEGRTTLSRTCVSGRCLDEDRRYDAAGRLWFLTYPTPTGAATGPLAETVEYTYDDTGTLHNVGSYATFDYELDGRIQSIDYGNGVKTTYAYHPARRWTDGITIAGPGQKILDLTYHHDATGRIEQQLASGVQPTNLIYHYDDLGRLRTVDSSELTRREQFDYDAIGRLRYTSRLGNIAYGDPRHLHAATSTDSGSVRQYDDLGNVELVGDPDGRSLALRWTVDGRIAEVTDHTHGEVLRWGYDIAGRRVEKIDAEGTTRYFGSDLEVDPSGTIVKYYNANGMLIARNDGEVHYVHQDLAHATRIETDAEGGLTNSYEYTAFGAPHRETETADHDIGFSGGRTEEQLGLVVMGARTYDPTLGRFLSADSVIPDPYRPQSLDRYSYVENDPVNHWDPSGHMRADIEAMMERKQHMRAFWVLGLRGVDCSIFTECESWMTGGSATNAGRRDFYRGAFLRGPSKKEREAIAQHARLDAIRALVKAAGGQLHVPPRRAERIMRAALADNAIIREVTDRVVEAADRSAVAAMADGGYDPNDKGHSLQASDGEHTVVDPSFDPNRAYSPLELADLLIARLAKHPHEPTGWDWFKVIVTQVTIKAVERKVHNPVLGTTVTVVEGVEVGAEATVEVMRSVVRDAEFFESCGHDGCDERRPLEGPHKVPQKKK
jgi:RHS repeat-associated protein